MKSTDRTRLTTALREHVARIAQDLRTKMLAEGPEQERARRLHRDESVGEDFAVWTDLLSRRAAVLWVLKSVYVRVLEDRGLLSPGRILDPEAQQLFEKLAPNLGETAFLRWTYRDLASPAGGLPELFAGQPAEVAEPADELSRGLISFWRHKDPDTGACWSFASERFEGELMGDLYQELDPVVKGRFALCQTPDFVRGFILDRTLTPAIEEYGADKVRLLDPACGSGHFLIDGLKRLVAATTAQHPERDRREVVGDCLSRVVGMDLNDYACALARARLVMTAAELAGGTTLKEAAAFHPQVYWADGLEQVEKGPDNQGQQLHLLDASQNVEVTRASLTRPEVRAVLKGVLAEGFQAVVANPPYITEKDPKRKEYHREKVGKGPRYVSAHREYSLGSPFTERCFQLAVKDGFVGLITGNNFMKREFGKPLIEKVLAGKDLTLVADTSQAHIPFHGTPTVLLFARNRQPIGETVRAVMGKRGETGAPVNPAQGQVWSSIEKGWGQVGFENEFVSVANVARGIFGRHPWSLGGGGVADLRQLLESSARQRLEGLSNSIGFVALSGADDIFLQTPALFGRLGILHRRALVSGDVLRDWKLDADLDILWPHSKSGDRLKESEISDVLRFLWPYRSHLKARKLFGAPISAKGILWWEVREIYEDRLRTPLTVAWAEVATHNHFVLDRSEKIFKQTAPVIKLLADATEEDHYSLLGLLNSSTTCFWMKQVFQAKAAGGIGRGLEPEPWMERYAYDSTKLRLFPVANDSSLTTPFARRLDTIAGQRSARSVAALLDDAERWSDSASLREALDTRRKQNLHDFYLMVGLQEELDWLCYRLYGLDNAVPIVDAEAVEPLPPTWLPHALNLAERDAFVRAAIASGDNPGELPTAWFERHGWQPLLSLPEEASPLLRERIERRRERIQAVPALALIERAVYKRRWYRPDYDAEEREALTLWLADRVEAATRERPRPFTLEQICSALQDDRRVQTIAAVLTGRRDFSLSSLVQSIIQTDSVPVHRFHVYKDTGLDKREVWETTWEAQRREDAGESVVPEVPPSYVSADFLKNEYWKLRGALDVPKERFLAFTEVPGRAAADTLYGWAGWTPLQRLKAILAIDEDLEDAGVPLADRTGLLDSAWRLLPDVARDDPQGAGRLKAELQALVGLEGPSKEALEDWKKRFPPPGQKPPRSKAAG